MMRNNEKLKEIQELRKSSTASTHQVPQPPVSKRGQPLGSWTKRSSPNYLPGITKTREAPNRMFKILEELELKKILKGREDDKRVWQQFALLKVKRKRKAVEQRKRKEEVHRIIEEEQAQLQAEEELA